MYFKSVKSGKVFQIRESDISQLEWMRAARGYEVKVVLKDGSVTLFGGFKESVSALCLFILSMYTVFEISNKDFQKLLIKEHFLRGQNGRIRAATNE